MYRIFTCLAATCLLLPAASFSQGIPYVFTWETDTLRFRWIETGDTVAGQTYPLIIWLHGKGERGYDNKGQWNNGLPELTDSLGNRGETVFILAPQCPPDQTWSYYDKAQDPLQYSATTPPVQDWLLKGIDSMASLYPVDTSRIMLIGISMGGFGVWDLIARYPGKFSAAVPVCGGGAPAKIEEISQTPVWAFHGAADKVVKPYHSQHMMDAAHDMEMDMRLTLYGGVGHNAWDYFIREAGFISWLLGR